MRTSSSSPPAAPWPPALLRARVAAKPPAGRGHPRARSASCAVVSWGGQSGTSAGGLGHAQFGAYPAAASPGAGAGREREREGLLSAGPLGLGLELSPVRWGWGPAVSAQRLCSNSSNFNKWPRLFEILVVLPVGVRAPRSAPPEHGGGWRQAGGSILPFRLEELCPHLRRGHLHAQHPISARTWASSYRGRAKSFRNVGGGALELAYVFYLTDRVL